MSPTMLERLREECAARRITNVQAWLSAERWELAIDADLVYSFLVLQHVEESDVLEDLVSRIALALAADGVAYLQFDTRPRTLAYRLRNHVPAALLPRQWRRGLRRVRRTHKESFACFSGAGLELVEELRGGTELSAFILRGRPAVVRPGSG
jgi:hypothetical protein